MSRAKLAVIVASILSASSSCARMPPVFSDDGAEIVFKGNRFTYRQPKRADTACQFDDARKLAQCEDGTASELTVAGLPFHGVVFVEFDGRTFAPSRVDAER